MAKKCDKNVSTLLISDFPEARRRRKFRICRQSSLRGRRPRARPPSCSVRSHLATLAEALPLKSAGHAGYRQSSTSEMVGHLINPNPDPSPSPNPNPNPNRNPNPNPNPKGNPGAGSSHSDVPTPARPASRVKPFALYLNPLRYGCGTLRNEVPDHLRGVRLSLDSTTATPPCLHH